MPGFKVPRCQWVPNHGVVAPMAPWHLRFSGSQLVGFSSKSKQNRADFLRFAIENASERAQNGPFEVLLRLKSTVLDAKGTWNRLWECVNCTARRTDRGVQEARTASRCINVSKRFTPSRSQTPFRNAPRLRFARAFDVCPRFHHRVLSSNSPNAVRALPGTSAKQSFAEVRSQTEFGNEGRFSISGLLLLKGRRSRWNPAHLQVPRVMLHYHRRPMRVATR